MGANYLPQLLKALCKLSGVQERGTHSLRRTYLKAMKDSGMSLPSIMRRSGHKSVEALLAYLQEETENDERAESAAIQLNLGGHNVTVQEVMAVQQQQQQLANGGAQPEISAQLHRMSSGSCLRPTVVQCPTPSPAPVEQPAPAATMPVQAAAEPTTASPAQARVWMASPCATPSHAPPVARPSVYVCCKPPARRAAEPAPALPAGAPTALPGAVPAPVAPAPSLPVPAVPALPALPGPVIYTSTSRTNTSTGSTCTGISL